MAAQEQHKSAYDGVLRDAAYDAVYKNIKTRGVTAQQVYPRIRHVAYKRLASGKEPEQFSLSALLRFSEVLGCRPAVHRALCSTAA